MRTRLNPESVPVMQRPAACVAEVRQWIATKDTLAPHEVSEWWLDLKRWGETVLLSALIDVLEGRG